MARTDSRHRTGAAGVIKDPHGPSLLIGVVFVVLDPFNADQTPPRFDPPAYLSNCLLVLRIVVCRFVANKRDAMVSFHSRSRPPITVNWCIICSRHQTWAILMFCDLILAKFARRGVALKKGVSKGLTRRNLD